MNRSTTTTRPGRDWWGQDSAATEQAALAAEAHGVRTVLLRTGLRAHSRRVSAAQVARFGLPLRRVDRHRPLLGSVDPYCRPGGHHRLRAGAARPSAGR